MLRDGAAWRARVELRDPRTANSVWEHETRAETSSLTRDVAYRLAAVLANDIDAHLKSRRTKLIEALRAALPFSHPERRGRFGSLEAAKAFEDGTALYDELEYAQARQAFRSAADLDPRNPIVAAWLSRAAQLVKDEREATEAAERAESLITPQTPSIDALFVRAIAAEVRRDLPDAERAYRQLVAKEPNEPEWAVELGGFLDRQTKRREAVASYHQALMLDDRLLRPRLELASREADRRAAGHLDRHHLPQLHTRRQRDRGAR